MKDIISAHDKIAARIFSLVFEAGKPQTLYDLIKKDEKLSTVHRHFQEMIKSDEIKIYKDEGIKKRKPYGPTVYGIISFNNIDADMMKKIDQCYDEWVKTDEFREELKNAGFDINKIQTEYEKTKNMFKTYVDYVSSTIREIEDFAENPDSIPFELQLFIGEVLLGRKKEYQKKWKELYSYLPGLKKNTQTFFESLETARKKLDEAS